MILTKKNRPSLRHTQNGLSKTSEYLAWRAMLARCYNKKNNRYYCYGGRGIRVCRRWRKSFENFLSDMGARPTSNHSIDRIRNSRNYTPENCRWGSFEEQQNNKTTAVRVSFGGKKMTVAQWSREIGIKDGTLRARIKAGYSPEISLKANIDLRLFWRKKAKLLRK